jgi:hypothetical protein
MWIPRYPKSLQEILRVIAIHKKLKASEISRITGFHKQTVYKGLSRLVEDSVVEIVGEGVNRYQLSDNVDSDQILKFFESERDYGISTIHGEPIDSVKISNSFRGTFFDFGFVPRKGVYGCRIFLESIPTSTIALLRNFTDMLKTLHYRLEEIYWTVDTYLGSQGSEFGVGIESLIKTISQESEQKKAAINVSFVVQDFFGGYFGFLYNVQARWINQGLNKGILDNIELFVVLEKIPIGKEFAISWTKKGMLPFVEEFTVEAEKVLDARIQLREENILGFVERFGHEIILAIPPKRGLPSKILVRTRFASIAIEDLTSGQPYRLSVMKYKINPRFSIDPLEILSRSPTIKLICAVISASPR